MKRASIFYIPLLIFIMQHSSSAETFIKSYRGDDTGIPRVMELTNDGNMVVMTDLLYRDQGQLTKLDLSGNIIWNKKYSGGSYPLRDFKETVDGNFVVVGWDHNWETNDDGIIIKFDSEGNPQWSKRYGGDTTDRIYAISLVSDGGYIVVGESRSFDPEQDMRPWIVRFDSGGNIIWQKTYVDLGDSPREVIENPDGSFIVAGGSSSAFIWKLNPDGSMIWDRTFDDGVGDKMIPTDDGGFIAIANGPSVLKFDSLGNITWNKQYAPNGDASDIFETSDGNYVITGIIFEHVFPWSTEKAFLLKIDSEGNRIFGKIFGGMRDEEGKAIIETPNGDIIIIAEETSFCLGNRSVFLGAKFNSSGEIEDCGFTYDMDEYLEVSETEEFYRSGSVNDTWGNIIGYTTNVEEPYINNMQVCPGEIFLDCDGDGFEDRYEDNCPLHNNPGQEDSYPPQGNGIGDACECEGNFDCDLDVDGGDAAKFKMHFGRSLYLDPCTDENPCSGDFDCDVDVDGSDAAVFKWDFSRSTYYMPCYICYEGVWCLSYPE